MSSHGARGLRDPYVLGANRSRDRCDQRGVKSGPLVVVGDAYDVELVRR